MPRVAQVIRDHGFDVFGVQEMVPAALAALESELKGPKLAELAKENPIACLMAELEDTHYPVAVSVVL